MNRKLDNLEAAAAARAAPAPTPTTAPTSAGDLNARVSHLEARLDRLERLAALLDQGRP